MKQNLSRMYIHFTVWIANFFTFCSHVQKISLFKIKKKRITSSLSKRKNPWLILARFPQIALFCWTGECDLGRSGQNMSWVFVCGEEKCGGKFKLLKFFEQWGSATIWLNARGLSCLKAINTHSHFPKYFFYVKVFSWTDFVHAMYFLDCKKHEPTIFYTEIVTAMKVIVLYFLRVKKMKI